MVKEGMRYYPPSCPRNCGDCRPLSLVSAHESYCENFICMGENDGSQLRVKSDRFRFCMKNREGIDLLINHDRRDLVTWQHVITQGLLMHEEELLDEEFTPTDDESQMVYWRRRAEEAEKRLNLLKAAEEDA